MLFRKSSKTCLPELGRLIKSSFGMASGPCALLKSLIQTNSSSVMVNATSSDSSVLLSYIS
jgi:hypothetical protein